MALGLSPMTHSTGGPCAGAPQCTQVEGTLRACTRPAGAWMRATGMATTRVRTGWPAGWLIALFEADCLLTILAPEGVPVIRVASGRGSGTWPGARGVFAVLGR